MSVCQYGFRLAEDVDVYFLSTQMGASVSRIAMSIEDRHGM
jgi:hypothetical protein